MEELDDLDSGTEIDLWDHKLAAEMRMLQEIFAEVVEKNARVSDHGRILDPQGRVVKDYSDSGLPAYLEFEMPAGAEYFTLDVNNVRVHQPLSDRFSAPASGPISSSPTPIPPSRTTSDPVTAPAPADKSPSPPVSTPASTDDDADAE